MVSQEIVRGLVASDHVHGVWVVGWWCWKGVLPEFGEEEIWAVRAFLVTDLSLEFSDSGRQLNFLPYFCCILLD